MHLPLRKGHRSLKDDAATLFSLFDGALDAIVVVSNEGRMVLVNAACERLFNYDRGELLEKGVEILLPREGRYLWRAQERLGVAGRETEAVRKDGIAFRVELSLLPLQTEEGEFVSVTMREPVAKQHADPSRSLLEAIPDPVIFVNENGKIIDINEATAVATGLSRDALLGSDFSSSFTDSLKAAAFAKDLFVKGSLRDYPLSISHRGREVAEVVINAAVYRDVAGKVVGGVAVVHDVTSVHRATVEFAEARNYLDSILQSSTKYSIIGMDKECRILSWNEGGRRNYGYSAAEIVGKDIRVLHTPEDVASGAVDRFMALALEQGVAEGEFTRIRNDGSRFEASVVVTRRNDLAGRHVGYLLMSSDISDRKEVEERLSQAAVYSRSLIEAAPDPLLTISTAGKIMDVNEATVRATGVPREELVGSDFALFFTEPERAREVYRHVFEQGHVTDYPLTMRHRSGSFTEVLYNTSVYKDLSGAVLGALAAARDVTQRKRLDEELMEAANVIAASSGEIMATIAEVASGATETAATVSETTSVTEQVKVAAQVSCRKARAVLDMAQQAVGMAKNGRKSVDESVAGMGRIQNEMTLIAETIARLSEQSQTIGEIIETVKDLAEQSNLLAVNAAIEAAKAGEVGKGFDVVAQEVKSLAAQSKSATARVRTILDDIQKATKAAIFAAEQGRTGVELGVRQTSEAGEVIRHMAESIEVSADAVAQIAASSQEHVTGMDQISDAMGNIKLASRQNVSGMRQVEETLQNLHSLGQKLKQLVERYR